MFESFRSIIRFVSKNIRLAYLYITINNSKLFTAVINGNSEKVAELLESSGIDVNAKEWLFGKTPLHYAVLYERTEIVELLTENNKVEVNAKDNNGKTPLHYAAEKGHDKIIVFLSPREVEARTNNGMLFEAASEGDLKRVKELLKLSKIDVNAKERLFGKTPLHGAVENRHKEVVKLLIEKEGINVNARTKSLKKTPLHYAATNGEKEIAKLLTKKLIEKKANINVQDEYGETPLHYAVFKRHKDVVIEICKSSLIGAYNEKAVSSVKDEWEIIMGLLRSCKYPHIDSLRGDVIENLKNERKEVSRPLARCAFTVCAPLSKVVEDLPVAPEIVKKFKDKDMISVKSALTMKNATSAIIKLLESEQQASEQPPSEQPPRQALNGVNVQLQNQEPQQQGGLAIRS